MEWYWMLLIILGGLILLLLAGIPVAFSFIVVALIMVLFLWGGGVGIKNLVVIVNDNMTRFCLLPIPLFILMGEVLFHSGVAVNMLDALDKWVGRLPGRLGFLAVATGTLVATMTGVSMSSCAILGSLLTPEMEKRGYKKSMSLGPILGSAGLAIMIPPSALAVFLGAFAGISIGRILIGIIMPGLLMAALYAAYIIIRCRLQPSIAPAYTVPPSPLSEKLIATAKYILPVGVIIFLVIGVILLGIATPSEAAATGALGTFILAAAYGRLNWEVIKKSLWGSLQITILVLTILVGALVYSQVLVFSGASRGLAQFIVGLPVQPIVIFIAIQLFGLFLGMFIIPGGVIAILVPLFMPVIGALGFNEVWFAVILLLNTEMATTSPPFGNNLMVMKGVAPPDTTMGDIYRAALPFLGCDLIVMALLIAFPSLVLWLPTSIMR
ncbi:TRAP transporter large permease subunit [Chloroflexota bacterium]